MTTRFVKTRRIVSIASLLIVVLVALSPACKSQVAFAEYSIPTAGSAPSGICAGPDGNVWYTGPLGNNIGKVTPAGLITEFAIPTVNSLPIGITKGSDDNLWFTEAYGNKIGRITPTGEITEFAVPTTNGYPYGIASGPDGYLWFIESVGNKIGRISTTGTIDEFPIPTVGSAAVFITAGSDGNMWFIEEAADNIGRISPGGVITEFPITAGGNPNFICAGPDGNLWFAEYGVNRIGRFTPAGVFTEFPIPTANSIPEGITVGPDGNLWFAEEIGNIARITPSGEITEFAVPTVGSTPGEITQGPDGNLWFTESSGSKIGKAAINTADNTPPAIAIASPTNTSYLLNQVVAADYSATDTESGVATCIGTVPNGQPINTGSVGTKAFTVTATDNSHNSISQTVTYTVGFMIDPLYDQTRAVRRGACYPIKLELLDANGANVSSAAIAVHAVSVTLASNNAPGTLESVGNANPDSDFRYDAALGGYIFNLSTAGLYTGTWNLSFKAGNDPTVHTVLFQVK